MLIRRGRIGQNSQELVISWRIQEEENLIQQDVFGFVACRFQHEAFTRPAQLVGRQVDQLRCRMSARMLMVMGVWSCPSVIILHHLRAL